MKSAWAKWDIWDLALVAGILIVAVGGFLYFR
jgi:hypothetical protein